MGMNKRVAALIKERDEIRGLVPSTSFGIKDKEYGAYLTKLNPRENPNVRQALACSPDPRFQEFLERVMMPRYKKVSMQSIAKACNIDLMEFNKWWQKESTQAALAVAQTASVDITRDMVEDARTVNVVCDRCDGMTWVSAPAGLPDKTPGYRSMESGEEVLWIRDCPVCTSGKIRKPGDAHARDRVLEMSGLTKKGGGMVLVQNFGGASHSSAVGELDMMTLDVTSEVG